MLRHSSYHPRPVSVVVGEVVSQRWQGFRRLQGKQENDAGDDLNWGARISVLAPLSNINSEKLFERYSLHNDNFAT